MTWAAASSQKSRLSMRSVSRAIELGIVGAVDHAHAPGPEALDDLVAPDRGSGLERRVGVARA